MICLFVFVDFLMLGNGFCGSGLVFVVMYYLIMVEVKWLIIVMVLLFVVLVFDFVDGCVVRWWCNVLVFGVDFDLLVDVILFGMVLVMFGFVVGLCGVFDVVILLYFVVCGISWFVWFNVMVDVFLDESGKVKYFEGILIFMSVVIVGVIVVFYL